MAHLSSLCVQETSSEVVQSCNDLNVLGKREFRTLMAWRLKAARAWRYHLATSGKLRAPEEVEPLDEEEKKAREMSELLQESRQMRREGGRRREAKERVKARLPGLLHLHKITPPLPSTHPARLLPYAADEAKTCPPDGPPLGSS